MEALADELEAVYLSLVVKLFELDDVFPKGETCLFEAGDGNRALVDRADSKNEFAEVFVVLVREDAIEDAGPKAVHIQQQLPGFITT